MDSIFRINLLFDYKVRPLEVYLDRVNSIDNQVNTLFSGCNCRSIGFSDQYHNQFISTHEVNRNPGILSSLLGKNNEYICVISESISVVIYLGLDDFFSYSSPSLRITRDQFNNFLEYYYFNGFITSTYNFGSDLYLLDVVVVLMSIFKVFTFIIILRLGHQQFYDEQHLKVHFPSVGKLHYS